MLLFSLQIASSEWLLPVFEVLDFLFQVRVFIDELLLALLEGLQSLRELLELLIQPLLFQPRVF